MIHMNSQFNNMIGNINLLLISLVRYTISGQSDMETNSSSIPDRVSLGFNLKLIIVIQKSMQISFTDRVLLTISYNFQTMRWYFFTSSLIPAPYTSYNFQTVRWYFFTSSLIPAPYTSITCIKCRDKTWCEKVSLSENYEVILFHIMSYPCTIYYNLYKVQG